MEKEGRNNSILLTVIAIATLLVTVAGATFAYFTAIRSGNETGSTIIVKTGTGASFKLETTHIDFDDIYPRNEEWATKYISITNTTDAEMSANIDYKLYFRITENTFVGDPLKFTLKKVTSGVCLDGTTSCGEQIMTTEGESSKLIDEITTQTQIVGEDDTEIPGDKIYNIDGTGTFDVDSRNKKHVYELKIFFPNTGTNQNTNQGKSFTAYVGIKQVNN